MRVDNNALLFQLAVQQQDVVVDEVGDQYAATVAVDGEVTRCLDVTERSQFVAVAVYFNHLHTHSHTVLRTRSSLEVDKCRLGLSLGLEYLGLLLVDGRHH